MAFICPDCSTHSLTITFRFELPGDSRSDEIALQLVECGHCEFAGIAVYEESRRGALDDESFDHTGYHIETSDLQALKKMLRQCPKPTNMRCQCPVHRQVGSRNAIGRWDGLKDLHPGEAFRMRR